MTIANVLKRIARGMGTTPEKAAMDYCFAHGFTAGKNFQYNSGYPIDANWPWLISIGDNVIIGAGSVVTHDVPSNCVYAGNPARFVCGFDEFQEKHLKNLETKPYFCEHQWNEWINVSKEEQQQMRERLESTFGYV